MTDIPTLALLDFDKQFIIKTDAFGFWLGTVLMQDNRPLAFFSQRLSPSAQSKSVYERELMVVFAIRKWRSYLVGQKFLVHTDQRSLKCLLEQHIIDGEFSKWLHKLMGYDFKIQYRLGSTDSATNTLSRLLDTHHFCSSRLQCYWILGTSQPKSWLILFYLKFSSLYGSSLIPICIFGLKVLIYTTRAVWSCHQIPSTSLYCCKNFTAGPMVHGWACWYMPHLCPPIL